MAKICPETVLSQDESGHESLETWRLPNAADENLREASHMKDEPPQENWVAKLGEQDGLNVKPPCGHANALIPAPKADTHRDVMTPKLKAAFDRQADVEEFEFGEDVWDASMLLFFGFKDGTSLGTIGDRIVMVSSILLTIAIQVTFVLIVWFNVLDNPYNDDTVRTMLRWRALQHDVHGEHGLEEMTQTGKTRINTFCEEMSYWSFEQSEYSVLDDYFHKGLPGQCLACAGLVIWLLFVFKEYRLWIAQLLALVKLPTVKPGCASITLTGHDEDADREIELEELQLHIQGVHRMSRILMILFLALPRFIVLFALCFVGCDFVVTEAGLADIILNCAALGFILDVPGLIYCVVFTDRIKRTVRMAQPIKILGGSNDKFGGFSAHDILRYFLLIVVCVLAIVLGLLPFVEHMRAADQALCGGDWNFLFSRNIENTTDPTIVIIRNESDPPVLSCDATGRETYKNKAYPTDKNRTRPNETTAETQDNRVGMVGTVLDYAFGSANTRIPTDLRPARKTTELLQTLYTPSGVALAACPKFNGTRESCESIEHEGSAACLWSYEAVFCERKDAYQDQTKTLNFRKSRPITEHSCSTPEYLTSQIAFVQNLYPGVATILRLEADLWWYEMSPTGRDPLQPACYYPEGGCNCSFGGPSMFCHPDWEDNPVVFKADREKEAMGNFYDDDDSYGSYDYYYYGNDDEPRRLEAVKEHIQFDTVDVNESSRSTIRKEEPNVTETANVDDELVNERASLKEMTAILSSMKAELSSFHSMRAELTSLRAVEAEVLSLREEVQNLREVLKLQANC